MSAPTIPFDDLATSDLIVDAVYEGGPTTSFTSEPIHHLLPVGNQGGFRFRGSTDPFEIKLVVLYTSGNDPDWPDYLDPHTGRFVYFGDNKTPGTELHDTPRGGNRILKASFDNARDAEAHVPPFFLFEKTGRGRGVRFKGLAVPGNPHLSSDSDLVAIWRTTNGERFQNYRAVFTVLDVGTVLRTWIDDIEAGEPDSVDCPTAWFEWSAHRHYMPLEAPRTVTHRTKEEQLPDAEGMAMLRAIHGYFADVPTAFEECAVAIWRMIEPSVAEWTITQASVDGGRDAVGRHALGPKGDRLVVDFALEAKCYDPGNTSVGVKDVSRLISRLLHRQYGVLVTTSYVGRQPYKEIRQDGHPVVIVAGVDVVEALRSAGIASEAAVEAWLVREFKL